MVGKLFFQHLCRIKYTLLCIDKWRNPDIGGWEYFVLGVHGEYGKVYVAEYVGNSLGNILVVHPKYECQTRPDCGKMLM